jgi:RES domain-containing protein
LSLTIWRLTQRRLLKEAFSGEGSRLYGSRWSSSGVAVVFASESQALAVLEVLVHIDEPKHLESFVLIPVQVDSRLITEFEQSDLVPDWQADPPPSALQEIGDHWVAKGKSAVLRVPSAILPAESNFLLNPFHRDFPKLKIGTAQSFRFDARLKHQ